MGRAKVKSKKSASKAPHDWIEWWMAPLHPKYDDDNNIVEDKYDSYLPGVVLAPNLEEAFRAARCRWPSASSGWMCLGVVNKRDKECVVKVEESGVMQLLKLFKDEK